MGQIYNASTSFESRITGRLSVLLALAFVFAQLLAGAHVAEAAEPEHQECGVCLAEAASTDPLDVPPLVRPILWFFTLDLTSSDVAITEAVAVRFRARGPPIS